jgi:hypothetical protein
MGFNQNDGGGFASSGGSGGTGNVTTSGLAVGAIPYATSATDIENSPITYDGAGYMGVTLEDYLVAYFNVSNSTIKVGIGDVNQDLNGTSIMVADGIKETDIYSTITFIIDPLSAQQMFSADYSAGYIKVLLGDINGSNYKTIIYINDQEYKIFLGNITATQSFAVGEYTVVTSSYTTTQVDNTLLVDLQSINADTTITIDNSGTDFTYPPGTLITVKIISLTGNTVNVLGASGNIDDNTNYIMDGTALQSVTLIYDGANFWITEEINNGGGGGTPTLAQVLAAGNVGGAGQEINLSDSSGVISTIWRGVTEAQGPIPAGLNASLVMGDQTTGFNCVIAASEQLTDYRLILLPDASGTIALTNNLPLQGTGYFTGTTTIGQTVINIPHGLPFQPTFADVAAGNTNTSGTDPAALLLASGYTIGADNTNIYVTLSVAASGVVTYNFRWFGVE